MSTQQPVQLRTSVQDAHGRAVRIIDPMRLHLLGREDVIEPQRLDRIIGLIDPAVRGNRKFMLILIVPAMLVCMVGFVLLMYLLAAPAERQELIRDVTDPTLFIICAPGLTVGMLTPWLVIRKKVTNRALPAILANHCCPHCGYGLEGVPRDPTDGVTICPECAHAWDLHDSDVIILRLGESQAADAQPRKGVMIALLLLGVLALLGVYMFYRAA
jgi:uncharacterized protein YbaR (Trm112 family)